jgi:hypothetical protein
LDDWIQHTTEAQPGFNFSSETGFPVLAGNEKFPEFRNFPDFPIGKRFEIQISVFDIFRPDFNVFRPDFGVFRPENVGGDRKL